MKSALETAQVDEILFHPLASSGVKRAGVRVVTSSIEVEPGVTLQARLYAADTPSPAVVWFHGNGEIAEDYDLLTPLFSALGVSVLVWDYRGYGQSGGAPSAATLLSDARVAYAASFRTLETNGLRPGSVFVAGRSIGSAPAIDVASSAESRPTGLIIESGFADTEALLRRAGWRPVGYEQVGAGFDNLAKIARVRAPTLILHGEEDQIIPVAEARQLHRHSISMRKRLVTIPGAGHDDLLDRAPRRYLEALRSFIHDAATSA